MDLDDRSKANLVALKDKVENVMSISDKIAYLNPSTREGYCLYQADPVEYNMKRLPLKRKLRLIVKIE